MADEQRETGKANIAHAIAQHDGEHAELADRSKRQDALEVCLTQ